VSQHRDAVDVEDARLRLELRRIEMLVDQAPEERLVGVAPAGFAEEGAMARDGGLRRYAVAEIDYTAFCASAGGALRPRSCRASALRSEARRSHASL
jgi:hypothetical protein